MDLQLRYFRFKTEDLDDTYGFWTSVMRMVKDSHKDIGTKVRCCLAYPEDSVGLRFEFDCLDQIKRKWSFSKEGEATRTRELPQKPRSEVTLLIHVHSVDVIVEKCEQKGYVVWLKPIITHGIKIAVLLDPSGIKVRIIENKDEFPVNGQSQGHLAYLNIPMRYPELTAKAIKFYDVAQQKIDPMFGARTEVFEKRAGTFTLQDQENFIEGLTSYNWLANGDRATYTSLCLMNQKGALTSHLDVDDESKDAGAAARTTGEHKKLFLGLSFFVSDLQAGRKQFLQAHPQTSFHIQEIPGFPRFIYFFDPAFVPVEISDALVTQRTFT